MTLCYVPDTGLAFKKNQFTLLMEFWMGTNTFMCIQSLIFTCKSVFFFFNELKRSNNIYPWGWERLK